MTFFVWKKIVLTIVALLIYGLISFSPLIYQLPPYIQVNIITVLLLTLIWGGPIGVLFVILVSVVNNNLVNGGGIVLYALLTKIFEVVLIAVVNWKQKYILLKAVLTAFVLIICVKPINILLYQCLSNRNLSELNFLTFFKTEYLFYLNHGLKNYAFMVIFSCICTWFILKIFFYRNKKLDFNYLGGIKICNDAP